MIRITSKVEGFRRAGIAHPATPTEHANDAFTKQQLAQLKVEPMLVVEEIKDETADKPASKTAAKKDGE